MLLVVDESGNPMPKAILEFMSLRGIPCLESAPTKLSAATKKWKPGALIVNIPPNCVPVVVKAVLSPTSIALTGRTRALSIVEFQL